MARVGYARVSTREQNVDSQLDALREAGCERVPNARHASACGTPYSALWAAMNPATATADPSRP